MTDHTAMSWVILLIVLSTGAAQNPSIITPPQDVTGQLGGTAEFKCEVAFKGIPVLTWEFNQNPVYSLQYDEEDYPKGNLKYSVTRKGGTFTLRISDLQYNDGGTYTCRVLDEADTAHLNVTETAEQRSIVRPPRDVTGKLKRTAQFTCVVKFKGIPVMSWEFSHKVVYSLSFEHEAYPMGKSKYSVEQDGKTFTLTVHDIHHSDAGTYTCRVLDEVGEANLSVIEAKEPSILTPPNDATGELEGEVKFKCEVDLAPIKVMEWEFNKETIYTLEFDRESFPKGSSKYSVSEDGRTFTLTVKDLQYSDAGKYACRVLKQVAEANLIVADTPKLLALTSNPVEGSTVQYICTARFTGPKKQEISAEHYPQLQMLFNGEPLMGTVNEQDVESATIVYYELTQMQNMSLNASMQGKELLCNLTSLKLALPKNITTEVLYPVRHMRHTPVISRYEEGTKIRCLADGNPEPHFKWDDTTNAGNIERGESLTITKRMIGSNIWRCTATNMINGQSHQKSVIVRFEVVEARGRNHSVAPDELGMKTISSESGNADSWKIAVGVTVPVCLAVMGVIITAWYCRRRKRRNMYYSVACEDGVTTNEIDQVGNRIEARNAMLTEKIALLRKEEDLDEEALKHLLRNETSLLGKNTMILLIRKSRYLIGSDHYFALMQEVVKIYKKNQDKIGGDPLSYLVEVLEVDSSLTQYHTKLINLLQILMPLKSSSDTRNRCMRVWIKSTLEWKMCKGDQDTFSKANPLQWRSDYIGILKLLLEKGADPSWSPDPAESSNLHLLMMVVQQVLATKIHLLNDLLELLDVIPKSSFQCKNVDSKGKTILHVLVDCKKNLLMSACAPQFQHVISLLKVKNSALLDAQDYLKLTPLHTFWAGIKNTDTASLNEDLLISVNNILLLLKTENNVNIQTENLKTILHEVVSFLSPSHNTNIRKNILDLLKNISPQNPDVQDKWENTALHLWVQNVNDWSNDPQFFIAVINCLQSPTNLVIKNSNKQTALHIFVGRASDWVNHSHIFLEVVRCLVTEKNITFQDGQGRTALQIFCQFGNTWKDDSDTFLKVFKCLISPANFENISKDMEAVHDLLTSWAKDLADQPQAFLEFAKVLISPDIKDKHNKDGDTILHKFISLSKEWKEHPKIFFEVVKHLKSPVNIDIKNYSDETALYMFTISAGDWKDHPDTFLEVVQCLKSRTNIYVKAFLGYTALHRFVSCAGEWKETPADFLKVVRCLSSANIDIRNNFDQTALHIFTSKGSQWKDHPEEFLQILQCLESPASFDVQTRDGDTPLHLFTSVAREWTDHPKQASDIVKHLKSDTNIEITNKLGNTALHNLTVNAGEWRNHPDNFLSIAQWLNSPKNIDCKNNTGATALHLFTSKATEWVDSPVIFTMVVECLKSPNNIVFWNDEGRTPLHLFMSGAHAWKDNTELFLRVVKHLMSSTVVDVKDIMGETALHVFLRNACNWNDCPKEFLEVVKTLISPNNVAMKSNDGSTALHLFTSNAGGWKNNPEKFYEVVQCLKSLANIDITNSSGFTALHLFTSEVYQWKDHPETVSKVVKCLISPINISSVSHENETALHLFSSKAGEWKTPLNAFSKVVELLRSPAVIDMKNKSGDTALHIFAGKVGRWRDDPAAFLDIIKVLKSPTNCDVVNSQGFTALHAFISNAGQWTICDEKFLEVVKLLKSPNNIDLTNNFGETALHIFTSNADQWKGNAAAFLEVVKLLKSSTNFDFVNHKNYTALHTFISEANEWQNEGDIFVEVVNCLKSKSNIDMQNDMRDTALHVLVTKVANWKDAPKSFLEVARLLKSSSNLDIRNSRGFTPLHLFISMADGWTESESDTYLEVVKTLKSDCNIDISNMKTTALHTLVSKAGQWKKNPGKFLEVVQSLRSSKNIEFRTTRRYTPLHRFTTRASDWKDQPNTFLEVVKILKSETNINRKNMHGHVPLHSFTRHASVWAESPKLFLEVVNYLRSDTNISIQNTPDGDTALHNLLAPFTNWGHYQDEFLKIVEGQMGSSIIELQKPRDTDRDIMYICLLKEVHRHNLQSFCIMINQKVSPKYEVSEENGQTKIKISNPEKTKWVNSLDVFLEVVEHLVSGENINIQNTAGDTALHFLARSKSEWAGSPEIHKVAKLLMSPQNILMKNKKIPGETPLDLFKKNWKGSSQTILDMASH